MSNNNLPVSLDTQTTPMANQPVPFANQPMLTNNQYDFISKLSPNQQMQILLAQQRNQTELTVEGWRFNNSLMLSDKGHQNTFAQMQFQANADYQLEAMKAQNAAALADKEHLNRKDEMLLEHTNEMERKQVDLQNQKAIAESNTEHSIITKLMEEDGKVRTSILNRMESSHKELGKTLSILRESFMQDKLSKRQHDRHIAQLHAEYELKDEIQGI